MTIQDIHLINFRNYSGLQMDFHPKTNVILGKNAVGKTNLCEAIYIAHRGRIFRSGKDRELIQFNKESAYIGSRLKLGAEHRFVEIKYHQTQKKTVRINESPISNLKELRQSAPVVLFTPNHLELVKGSPGKRREFLDQLLSMLSPLYEDTLRRYYQVMSQRNQLLKERERHGQFYHMIDIYDDQLIKYGSLILRDRLKLLTQLSPLVHEKHQRMTRGRESLQLSYCSFMPWKTVEPKAWQDTYRKLLKDQRSEDMRFGTTGIGPHRDDITFMINEKEAKTFGSQGQQRSVVLSLKLAEVDLIETLTTDRPILILDDVFSELDHDRKGQLMTILKRNQSFITMTDPLNVEELQRLDKQIYYIEDKKIKTIS